jgi:hypothetical protein
MRRAREKLFPILAAILVGGCGRSDSSTSTESASTESVSGPSRTGGTCTRGSANPGGNEGEFIGRIYSAGQLICPTNSVTLVPDAATDARLDDTYASSLQINASSFKWDFDWWDPVDAASHCVGFTATHESNVKEKHAIPGQNVNPEAHCIVPGRYTFTYNETAYDLEYIAETNIAIYNQVTGQTEEVLALEDFTTCPACYRDLILLIDPGGNESGEAHFDVDTLRTTSSNFTGVLPAFGTFQTTYRFSYARTTAQNPPVGAQSGDVLIRYFWDYENDLSKRTGFFNHQSGSQKLIRTHRFPNPIAAVDTFVVGFDVLRPNQTPSLTADETKMVIINRVNPNLITNAITAPDTIVAGNSANITVQAKNIGTGTAEPGWNAKLYLSTDAVFNRTQDLLLTGGTTPAFDSLPLNALASRNTTVTIAGTQAAGNYTLFAEVDGSLAVIEGAAGSAPESDNHLGKPITITAPPCNWEPSGLVGIAVGTLQSFIHDISPPCVTHQITITPSNAPFGFSSGTACTLKTINTAVVFKVRSCANGTGTVTIRLGTTVVETIQLETPP